jgi:hypothetical protein
MAAREHVMLADSSGNGDRAYERTASYMAQTESSLRHASIGSEASITDSIWRLRSRPRGDGDQASDVASVASSQWSVRRRRVGPRPARPVERLVPATTTERAQRIAARTALQRPAEAGETTNSGEVRLRANPVVVRGGARVSASRKASIAVSDDGSPNMNAVQRLSLSGSGAGSPSLTTVTVSDEDTGELTKSGVSVSLSPITPGARSARKSLHHTRLGSSSGGGSISKNVPDFLSSADGDGTVDEYDAQDEPVARATQPVSADGYGAGIRGGGHAAVTLGRSAPGPDKAGRPPLTPRGDASPRPGVGVGGGVHRSSSLGGAAAVPATTLTSNTVHRHSSSADYPQQQQQQQRNSVGDAAVWTRGGASVGNGSGTAIHRVTEGRRTGADYDAVGRKSLGEESVDDTPISVLKERANREAERNARRDANQPVVPRLALGEITAKRDGQRRSMAYKAAPSGPCEEASDTLMTGGSVLSDVTVSSMTDSATPHVHGSFRSGRSHAAERHGAHDEVVVVDPSPSASAVPQTTTTTTYDSHGSSPARAEPAPPTTATTVTPSRKGSSAKVREDSGATATVSVTHNTAAPTNGGGKSAAEGTPNAPAEAKPVKQKPAPKAEGSTTRPATSTATPVATTSTSAAAPAASTPVRNDAGEAKKRRAFERSGAATAPSKRAPPPPASTKENAKCCAVM